MRRLFLSISLGVLAAYGLASPASADESTPSASEAVADTDGSATKAAEPEAKTRKPAERIEEITVTARKREESLQETPISITAFSADDIKEQEINRIQDVSALVPNLQFDQAVGSSNAARITIRGIGNGDPIITDDPGVGLYVDGVYLPRAQGALLAVSDIERIEVLRGPQGTLFGKNTVGGAVSIVTKKPSYEFGGQAEVRAGNYDMFGTKFSVNLPIVPERVSSRLSFSTSQRDGYTKNTFRGGDTGRSRLLAGRAQFLVNATDNLEFLFSVDRSIEPNGANTQKCKFIGPRPAGSRVETPEAGASTVVNLAALVNAPVPGQSFANLNDNAYTRACQEDDRRSNRKVSLDGKLEDELKTWGTTLISTWSPSDSFSFKSTSSWRQNKGTNYFDGDGTFLAIAEDLRNENDTTRQNAFSQEFNFSGNGLDNKLKWTFGGYGFREVNQDNDRGQALPITNAAVTGGPGAQVPLGSRGFLSDGGPDPDTGLDRSGFENRDITALRGTGVNFAAFPDLTGSADCNPAAPPAAGVMTLEQQVSTSLRAQQPGRLEALEVSRPGSTVMGANGIELRQGALSCTRNFIGLSNVQRLKSRTLSYAAYSQATYDVTDAFSITAGLRFTHEQKRVFRFSRLTDPRATQNRVAPQDFARGNVTNVFESTVRFSEWTPSLNLQYVFNDDVNVYANFSKGFKSGGFNGRANGSPFDPEKLTSYEGGLKSRFFDDRLQMNLAAFTNVYRDIQLTVIGNDQNNNIIVTVDNAGKAIIHGGELESTLLVPGIDGLLLSGNLGITAARYVEFDRAGFSNVKLPNTPAYTGTVTASYTVPVGSLGDLTTRLTWRHTGKKGSDVSDPHYTRINKNGVLSGRIAWAMADGKTEIAIFGNNLLDREYIANAIDINALGTAFLYYAPPLTYGLEVSRNF